MIGRRSITLGLTLLFSLTSAGVLLGLGAFITSSVEPHFEAGDREMLYGKLQLVRHTLHTVRTAEDLNLFTGRLENALIGHHGLAVAVLGPDGQRFFLTPGADFPDAVLAQPIGDPSEDNPEITVWENNGHTYRGLIAAAKMGLFDSNSAIVALSVDIGVHRDFLDGFRYTLWISIVLAILCSAVLGGIAVHRGLIPVHQMALVARRISADRLKDRIRMESLPRELVELAAAFNEMLTRLEDAFGRLKDFSADIAHELRTPISNLMTQTEVALSRPRSVSEYQDILQSNLEEYGRLARMISDMLFLAQADNGMIVPTRERIDLAVEVKQLFEFYEALCEDNGINLKLTGAATTNGDRLMLRRALSNLLSNAVKHTQRGGQIEVTLRHHPSNRISIHVANSGEVISPEHLPRLFDRFYRADASRTSSDEGAGLGLAITKSIVEAHRGQINVSSQHGKTVFEISLPGPDERLTA